MLVISIILTVLGLSLILVSLIVSKSDSLDLRENLFTWFMSFINRISLFDWSFR